MFLDCHLARVGSVALLVAPLHAFLLTECCPLQLDKIVAPRRDTPRGLEPLPFPGSGFTPIANIPRETPYFQLHSIAVPGVGFATSPKAVACLS